MSQIRFNIGVPRGGSAARIAEEGDPQPRRSLGPQAGSAAREAEERKRAEGGSSPRAFAIGLRAQGARMAAVEGSVDSTEPLSQPAVAPTGTLIERHTFAGTDARYVHAGSTPAIAPTSAEQVTAHEITPPPVTGAASRIKSLVQSLFSSGASSS